MKSPKPRASKAAKKKTAKRKAARPFVAATFAMTVDGKITTRTFSPVDFTSREDKLHLLADAVVRRRRPHWAQHSFAR